MSRTKIINYPISEVVEIPLQLPDYIQNYLLLWKYENYYFINPRWFEISYHSAKPHRVKLSACENVEIVSEIFGMSWESEQNAIIEAFKNMYFTGSLPWSRADCTKSSACTRAVEPCEFSGENLP